MVDTIRELDRRGIVSTVVSKNDYAVAWPILERLGLAQYFVFPQISWAPKSSAVATLIEAFNVGADTVAVIDDSEFERAEIGQRCPQVRLYRHDEYRNLPSLPEFRPPLSDESAQRRMSYKAEEFRTTAKVAYEGDYASFLRSCEIVATVRQPGESNLARVYELVQRTNQLNFSGRRYTSEELRSLLGRSDMLPITVHCRDRFGDYGLVGFISVDLGKTCVTDLMFSCRVQAKGVERAVFAELMARLHRSGSSSLDAMFKPSAKNGPAKAILSDLGFELIATDGANGVQHWRYRFERGLPINDVVTLDWSQDT